MQQFTFLGFIDFLQDNFKTELYRNDIKSIIDKLTNKQFDVDSPVYQNLGIDNRLFLYAFFLVAFRCEYFTIFREEFFIHS